MRAAAVLALPVLPPTRAIGCAEFAFRRWRARPASTGPRATRSRPAMAGLFRIRGGPRAPNRRDRIAHRPGGLVRSGDQFPAVPDRPPRPCPGLGGLFQCRGAPGGCRRASQSTGRLHAGVGGDRDALQFVQQELLPVWMAVRETTRTLAMRWFVAPRHRVRASSLRPTLGFTTPWSMRMAARHFRLHGKMTSVDLRLLLPANWSPCPSRLSSVSRMQSSRNCLIPIASSRAALLLLVYCMKWVCIRMKRFSR